MQNMLIIEKQITFQLITPVFTRHIILILYHCQVSMLASVMKIPLNWPLSL